MKSNTYREIIRTIVKSALSKRAPGFNKAAKEELANIIAVNIYARMYGANVDGVDSPLWRRSGDFVSPNVDAFEILKQGTENEAS
jgi:hypothetical protein